MKTYIINIIIKIILKTIQGQKIYLSDVDVNLFDIESIYKGHPEITCRFLIEENLSTINLTDKIKEALQNYPKLNGLDFKKIKLSKITKQGEEEELEINENKIIKTILKSKDKIYFDLDLEQVWLNIDLSLIEAEYINEKIKIKKANLININLDIKIQKQIKYGELKDILLNTSLEILGYRGENKEEEDYKNESANIEENDKIDYYLFYNFENKTNIDIFKNSNRLRSRSIKSKRKLNGNNNININNNNNDNNKNEKIFRTKNCISQTRIEMKDLNIKNFMKFKEKNNNYNEIHNNSKEIKETPKITKDNEKLNFNFNDKMCCNVIYINFTNYILTNEEFTLKHDISYIKRLFNRYFAELYENEELKLDEQFKIKIEKKLLYLISSKNNQNKNNISFKHKKKVPKDALVEDIKKIDYNKKINELNNLKKIEVFKEELKREETHQSENIRYNKSIFNEEIEPVNDKKIEKKIKLIKEEKLNNNYENNDNLQKKAILVIIIIILFILILIKIF